MYAKGQNSSVKCWRVYICICVYIQQALGEMMKQADNKRRLKCMSAPLHTHPHVSGCVCVWVGGVYLTVGVRCDGVGPVELGCMGGVVVCVV
jgi:hypothetical protein